MGFVVLPATLLTSSPDARAASPHALVSAPVTQLGALTASGCPAGLTAGPPVSPPGGQPFVVCSGTIRSFDGTPLDTDVSVPVSLPSKPGPLMILLHGWGNSKTEWESTTLTGNGGDKYHWNNAWFASLGYVVLNYTARGFHRSCGKDAATNYSYATEPTCKDTTGEASWTHLADRRWEVHDSQYLAGLLVDAGLVSPKKIVVSGGSYGGGQSWDLALSQNKVVLSGATDPVHLNLQPWISPHGTKMRLAAAIPHYPWTDLADALLQNGRAADGFYAGPADGDHHAPFGVDKQSYVTGLFALGGTTAQFSTPKSDPTADLTSWNTAINAGEPYSANPDAVTALAEVGGAFRSPFAMRVPVGKREIPVFVIQGQTDPLFPALQALDMVNRLKAADPNWPVTVFLGDIGHSYAGNPTDIWQQAHDASNSWLQSVLAHVAPSVPAVTVTTTACLTGQTHVTYTASSYGTIASSVLHLTNTVIPGQSTASSNAATNEGTNTDPIAHSGCRTMAASQSDPNQAVYTFPVPSGVLVGAPSVSVDVAVTGVNAEVAARLWEIDGSGNQTLITRTVYRIEETGPTTNDHLHFELWPQAWQFQTGDTLKLELTQDDSPVWRPVNPPPSGLKFTNLDLALPLA
jgi:pimeloyl-ACP methyl ester carboxylesterase